MRLQDSFNEPKLSLLINGPCGITTKALQLNRNNLSLNDNYNDDFLAVHELILKRLSKRNDKGLILLHGKPGTGKTSYIRHLAAVIKKRIIFIPPNMAAHLTNPGLMEILMDNQNSILIIEDAETMLIDRNIVGESPVSALLNLTDGLLSDCVNIQVICSFNTDLTKLDAALLRKGRLIARYEFKELEAGKAQLLSNKLGFQKNIDQALTLTEIYNQQETTFETEIPVCKIGFRATIIE
jgi:SpoVK/Ycf46/Vps4 family AAA+-type ATPase